MLALCAGAATAADACDVVAACSALAWATGAGGRPQLRGRGRDPRGLDRNGQHLPGVDAVRPPDLVPVGPVQDRPRARVVVDLPGDRAEGVAGPDGVLGGPARRRLEHGRLGCAATGWIAASSSALVTFHDCPADSEWPESVLARAGLGIIWADKVIAAATPRRAGAAAYDSRWEMRKFCWFLAMAAQRAPSREVRAHWEGRTGNVLARSPPWPSERLTSRKRKCIMR